MGNLKKKVYSSSIHSYSMRNDWKCPLLDSVLTPVGQTGSGMSAIINYIFVSKSSFRLWIKPVSRSCWKFCAMFFDFLMGSLYETVNSGIPSSSLPPSLLSPAALCTVRQQYLLLWISFVLIIRINDCLAIWMPHLEKLGSHVTVINYRQASASPEAFSPLLLLHVHTAVGVFHVLDTRLT